MKMSKEDQKIIHLKEKVTVIPTDKNKHQETGKPVEVHPLIAEKGIANGMYEKPKGKKD